MGKGFYPHKHEIQKTISGYNCSMPVFLTATAGLTIIASMFFASSQIFSTQFLALRERIEDSLKIQVPVAAVLNSNPPVLFNEYETIAQKKPEQMQQLAVVQTLIAPVENFPPQTEPLYGAQIYTPENTYTTINSKDIEQRLLIQKNYFSKQIDRIYDRIKSNTQDVNDRVDLVTTTSSGISFATIALGGTGISAVPNYGELLMGDGSGGYTLIATSSLGISSGGSSQWTTNGSDIYYTTGSVGIGTTTVNRKLVVDNNTTSGTVATFQSYAAGSDVAIRVNNNSVSTGSLTETAVLNFTFNDLVGASITGGKTEDFMSSANRSGYLAFNTRKDNVMSEALRINTGGNIGIGTTTPSAKLSVEGETMSSYFTAASSTRTSTFAGSVGIQTTPSSYTSLGIDHSGIEDESSAIEVIRNVSQTADNSSFHFGIDSGVHWNLNGFNQTGDLRASYGGFAISGASGTATKVSNFHAYTTLTGGANITNAFGLFASLGNSGTGEITNLYGSLIQKNGTGKVDNFVGYQVQDTSATTSVKGFVGNVSSGTGKYNLYLGGTAQNYFAGNVGIGTTTPSTKFQVYSNPTRYVSLLDINSTVSSIFRVDDNSAANILTLENRDITATTNHGVDIEYRLSNNLTTTAINAGTIRLAKDQLWTSDTTTQDSYFAFSIATNGVVSEKLRIASDGNLGIGTTTPFAKFSINSLTTDTGGQPSFIIASSTTTGIDTHLFVSSTGRVGIGTTSPQRSLHVVGSGIISERASADPQLILRNSGYSTTGQDWNFRVITGDGSFVIRDGTGPTQDIFTMTVDANVGISTSTPYAKLSVAGGSVSTTTMALRPFLGQTANILDIYNPSGFLSTVITSSGNWGIGTTSPYAKLSVEGQLVSSFITTSNSTATSTIAGPLGVRRLLYPNGEILTDTTNFVIGSTASSTLFYPNNMPLATADGTLYYGDSNVLATKGAGIVSAKIYYPNNNVLVDAQALYYPSGTSVLTDITGQIYYHNSTVMSDANSRLYYGSGAELADELGNLNYGNGLLLADANGDIYDGHATDSYLFDVGNLYLRNRLISNSGAGGISIDDLGNVGIGEASPTYPLHVTAASLTDVARFVGTGGTQCTVVTGTGFSCTSDERFKTNIATINSSALQNVLKLRPVNFNWKYDPEGQTQVGFIAQELEEIFPELVRNDSSGYKSVAYAQLTPLLVKAIQEQNVSIEKLSLILDSGDPLPKIFVDRIIAAISQVSNLVVKTITADSVRTKELCVEDVCVTREQFLKMIRDSGARESTPQQDDQDEQDSTEQENQQDESDESQEQEQDGGEQNNSDEENTEENSNTPVDENVENSEEQPINDDDQVITDTPETTDTTTDEQADSQNQDGDSGGEVDSEDTSSAADESSQESSTEESSSGGAEGDSAGDSNVTE